jgi:hypothetical protein
LHAISVADSSRKDNATLIVKRDAPVLNIGKDTTVGLNRDIAFTPTVQQEFGGITLFAWDLDGDGKWDDSAGAMKTVTARYTEAKTISLGFRVRDGEGNETVKHKTLNAVEGPVIAFISPRNGDYSKDKNITVRWSIDDNEQAKRTTETLAQEGPNVITREAKDSAGNVFTAAITVILDTKAPKVPVMTNDSAFYTTTPRWTWKSGGGGNGHYRLRLDEDVGDGSPLTLDSTYLSPKDLILGLHTLFVQERDTAGNWSASALFPVRIVLGPPGVSSVSSVTTTSIYTRRPTWVWHSGGHGGIGKYRVKLDTAVFSGNEEVLNDSTYKPDFDLNPGTHILYVQEQDATKSWGASGSAAVKLDFTIPAKLVITVATPTNNRKPTFSWIAASKDVTSWIIGFDTTQASGLTQVNATTFTPTSDLAEGLQTLFVQEVDSSGNASTFASSTVRIDLTVPNAPVFQPLATKPLSTLRPTWAWTANSKDAKYWNATFDTTKPNAFIKVATPTFTPDSNLIEGLQKLFVQEVDSAGNASPLVSGSLRLDITPPNAPVFSENPKSPLNSIKPTWLWAGGGNGGMGNYRCKVDDSIFTITDTIVTSGSFTPKANLTEAPHKLFVQERDSAGNWSVTSSHTLVLALRGLVGNTKFNAGQANSTSLAFSPTTGVPYVAFDGDITGTKKANVMKLNTTTNIWEVVGNPNFTAGWAFAPSIAFSPTGVPYIAYMDYGNTFKANVMRLNTISNTWEVVGTPNFSTSSAYTPSLAFSPTGVPYVACHASGGKAYIMRLNAAGTSWEVYFDNSPSVTDYTSLAFSPTTGMPYVAFSEGTDVMKVTVSGPDREWHQFSSGRADYISLSFSSAGIPYIAYCDTYKANVMRLNATTDTWEVVGTPNFSTGNAYGTSLALSPTGVPYVAYYGYPNNQKANLMRLNTTMNTWEVVGMPDFSDAHNTSLAFSPNGVPYVVCVTFDNYINVMKVSFDP